MGLVPEFFMLLGIDIFLAMSLLSALLDENFPSPLQYLFQGAGLLGLAQLFLDKGFIESAVFTRDPTDLTRFWISIVYLSTAVVSVIGLNVYLAAIRRKLTLAATFTGTVTVPAVMASVFFVYSYIASAGDVALTPATAIILAISALVSGLSVLGFLRQALRHVMPSPLQGNVPGLQTLSNTAEVTTGSGSAVGSPGPPVVSLPFRLPSRHNDEWEEATSSTEEEERGGENTR